MAKILIVDDSSSARRILRQMLEPDGHEVLEARWFAPADIPWNELSFPTTHMALRDWLRTRRDTRRRRPQPG